MDYHATFNYYFGRVITYNFRRKYVYRNPIDQKIIKISKNVRRKHI